MTKYTKKTFSHSEIVEFLSCEEYYYYKRILRNYPKKDKFVFVNGRIFHQALEQMILRKLNGLAQNFEDIREFWDFKYNSINTSSLIDFSEEVYEKNKLLGIKGLEKFSNIILPKLNPVCAERKTQLKIGEYIINGITDYVDGGENELFQERTVVDWKTTSVAKKQGLVTQLQILLYMLSTNNTSGAVVSVPKTKSCNILIETWQINSREQALKYYTELVTPILLRIIDLWEGNSAPVADGCFHTTYGDSPCSNCENEDCIYNINNILLKNKETKL